MLKELLSIFRSDNPLKAMGDDFAEMLALAYDLMVRGGRSVFDEPATPEERTAIYKQDVRVNKLERTIRKRVIAHLSTHSNSPDLPYCLLLMSLVKDVERIGDYAKNLSEVRDVHRDPLPDDEITAELREIRDAVEEILEAMPRTLTEFDREAAMELIKKGQELAHRSDSLVPTIARSDYGAAAAAAGVLTARFYKRVNGHVLNMLSGVVMPLHKLDYYDEKELESDDD